jgi:hypothetical protein
MMDLNKMVNDSLAKIEAEGFVEKVVEKQLKSTIEIIIDDLFRSYSDFGKNLKKEIESQLNINLKELKLSGYNVLVLNTVKEKLDEALHLQGVEKMQDALNEIFNDTKKEYKLSEIINAFKQDVLSDDSAYEGNEISFHVEKWSYGVHIAFDKDSDKGRYSCDYQIGIDSNGKMTRADIDGKKFDNKIIMGGLYGFDETLFKIYASGAKVIIDDNDVDIEYGYSGEDD